MVKESESFKQNAEGKNKAQKRKKDEASADTSGKEDIPSASKKIVPSSSSQEEHHTNVKTPKIKTVSKNNSIKKVAKKIKAKVKNSEDKSNIDNSLSEETSKISETVVDTAKVYEESTCVNSVQTTEEGSSIITTMEKKRSSMITVEEGSSMKTNVYSPSCKLPSIDDKTDEVPCKDETRKDVIKELNSTQIPKEFNIPETSVIQILSLESSLKDSVSSSSSETNQNSTPEKKFDLIEKINVSNDPKPEEQKPKNDDCKSVTNKQNSSQNYAKSDILSEPETCQSLSTQVTLIQNQVSLLNTDDSNQNALTQHEKSNECKLNDNDSDTVINSNNNDPSKNLDQGIKSNKNDPSKDSNPVIDSNKHPAKADPANNSNGEFIYPVPVMISNEKEIESFVLKAALKENNKDESIPKSNENFGSNQPPESEQFKEPVIFDDDDSDLTDSQLCETEWTSNGDFLSENAHSKKNEYYLAKVKKAKRDGSQIVNELITELSQLNKRLLHFKREMDAVCKRRKITTQLNVIKKRTHVQTVLGQFR